MKSNRLKNLLIIAGIVTSCQTGKPYLKEGIWRGTFSIPGNEIPFLFEVKGNGPDSTSVVLINGTDRFTTDNPYFRNDSVFIPIDLYDAVLKGKQDGKSINGKFIKNGTGINSEGIPFKASWGKTKRFPANNEPPFTTLSGTWDCEISIGNQVRKTVGVFKQEGSSLIGSILAVSGDYRFLEGIVNGKEFILSEFCGSTPYLVKGGFTDENTFTGQFITPWQTSQLTGRRNPNATLPDPYKISQLKEGYSSIRFSFPDLNGNMVSLSDPQYKGKVVIITILGSWCPNCLDENAFLSSWYKANHERGVEIVGLGFEKKEDFKNAQKSLSRLKKRLDIPYKILVAGKSTTASASQALPQLTGIYAFPTTLFIDKKGVVRKIHTGFSGPATSKFYEEYKAEFNQFIDQLLEEKYIGSK